MTQFKIQKEKSFDTAKLWKVTKNILIGQIFVTIPTGHFYAWLSTTYGYGARSPAPSPPAPAPAPAPLPPLRRVSRLTACVVRARHLQHAEPADVL